MVRPAGSGERFVLVTVGTDASDTAIKAADALAEAVRAAVALRGRAAIALSGGETPWLMLRRLRELDVPWDRLNVAQVDERVVPAGDPRRNLARLTELLVTDGPLPPARLLAMPVTERDLEGAAARYQSILESVAGRPLVLDVVQLGLGTDGHTASLVPGDPVLQVRDRDVALTAADYQGSRRMTLTFPALGRARRRLWLVTGAAKAARLGELLRGTGEAPAVRLPRSDTTVFTDAAANPA